MTEVEFGRLQKLNVQKTIDLEDITGTGFAYTNPNIFTLIFSILHFLVGFWFIAQSSSRSGLFYHSDLSIVPILLIIFGIIWLIVYLTSRHTLFFVEYAGGSIRFDASAIGLRESQIFEKNIRIAKNLLKKKKEK